MKRNAMNLLTGLALILVSGAGQASQPEDERLSAMPADQSRTPFNEADARSLESLQPGDQLDQALYQRGQISRFGIRREIVRIGNREFIIDDQNRQIIHISVY